MRRGKYNARKTVIDNIEFASKREAKRYAELKLMERAGEIKGLILQPRFLLQPKFERHGKKIRAIEYVADFEYTHKKRGRVVEDSKGMRTEVYKIKRKMFMYQFPLLTLEEV